VLEVSLRPRLKTETETQAGFESVSKDVEDLIELRSAIERNAGKPGVSWDKVKAELELD
jgi:hypothetical protein